MSTKKQIEEKVFSFMEEHHMLKPDDRVVVGVSGGADSVCLLFVLLQYAKSVPLSLAVAHINHGIRREAADDARYVEELCRKQGIPFYLTEADVLKYAADEKCSEEEAGRVARYKAFLRASEDFHADKIAVAHNSNDRSETMLFHLFRGSGIKGLGSIQPVRENIIRPLLCLERREIEEYLELRDVSYCQDATNEKDDYTRNRIRHHILPYAEKELVTGCVGHMAQTADLLLQVEDYLEKQTEKAMEACVEPLESSENKDEDCGQEGIKIQAEEPSRVALKIEAFRQQHFVIQERILLKAIKSLTLSGRDIGAVHVRALQGLFDGGSGRSLSLPFDITARREYERVILEKAKTDKYQTGGDNAKGVVEEYVSLDLLGEKPYVLSFDEATDMIFSAFSYEKGKEVPKNKYTKWFDYDKMIKSLVVRNRRQGDFLSIKNGDGTIGHKSLKDYMITEKIPRFRRELIPILAEENHVLWLVGYRISEYYKINEQTKRVMQVQLVRKKQNGGKNERAY